MPDLWTPGIVAVGVIVGPLFLAWLTGRQRSAEKREDWARQDAVADKVDAVASQARKAAELLRTRQDEVAGKLNQIHDLVNSNLTTQMEEALAALTQQVVLMREVVDLNRAAGREPSRAAIEAIGIIEAKVGELHAKLADRR